MAEKSLQALKTIDVKLKKEITNFINLKTKLAIAKSGIDPRLLPKDQVDDFMSNHSVLFADLEHRMLNHL